MSGVVLDRTFKKIVVAGAVLLGASSAFANDNKGTAMTAGVIVKKMPARERASYVMGMIDAMAYARFVKDTKAKGEKDQAGMACIYDWFHKDGVERMVQIDTAFRKYASYPSSMVVTAMVKKACGE